MVFQDLQSSVTFVGTGEFIEEANLVEFRLLYEGELLPSTNTKRRAKEKHAIRRTFHPQLRRLWEITPSLRSLADHSYYESLSTEDGQRALEVLANPDKHPNEVAAHTKEALKFLGEKWARVGFNFIPLVTEEMALRCSLDITLLRPEDKRLIFEAGDIDGQLKTLLDALKMPKHKEETGSADPDADEDPFYCLLEDDRLISEVKVTTDTMLLLPNHREVRANDAHAIIHVKLNHRNPGTFTNYFG